MDETLTECLIRVREDLAKSKKGRDYLDTNAVEDSRLTKRLFEPRSIILEVCSSQNTPEIDELEKSLHSFHLLVSTNKDPNVWNVFGYELGVVCAKFLSSIEKVETFEVMLLKLLTIINEISKHNLDAWKATARQILNLLINKKFTPEYFEAILKKYIIILRNIDDLSLYNFSLQNLCLVKTLSALVQSVGDYEIQFAIMRIVFLHLSNERTSMTDIFVVPKEDKLNQSLTFDDFEQDCRFFLNALNKLRGRSDRKVCSISCQVLYLGGCFVEPLIGRKVIWVDANKETERVSIRYTSYDSEDQSVIYLMFSEIVDVQIDNEKTEGNCCVTIQTKNLRSLYSDVENDDICLVVEDGKEVVEFVNFLATATRKKVRKFSKTDMLLFGKSNVSGEGLQVNSVSSSARSEMNTIPDIISAFGEPYEENVIPQTQIKTPPLSSQERKVVLETQDSPSFLAEMKRTLHYEGYYLMKDITQTQKLLQSETHKLMSSQEKVFLEPAEVPFCFEFCKENQPPDKPKTYSRISKPVKKDAPNKRVLRERKQPEAAWEDCFRQNVQHKKPSLPKFNRKKKQPGVEKKTHPHRNARYKQLPISGITEQPEPSLLDPNGYAFQRWKQPTTSERSNFWLKKLEDKTRQKADVFEFSDSDSEPTSKYKRRIVHSKRRYRKQKYDTKQPSLKQVTEFLRNVKKPSPEKKKPNPVASPQPDRPYDARISNILPQPSPKWNEPIQPIINRHETTPELSSDGEPQVTQKRDRSQEENSLTRVHLKKKTKTKPYLPETFLPMINRRLQRLEDKARQQTNEIISTVNKAVNQLLNHLQGKQEMKVTSYLKVAEEASTNLEDEKQNINVRVRRLQKAVLYFKAGCSVSELHQSLKNHFDQIRDAFKDMETKTDPEKKINRVTYRLKSLIESEINKSIKNELTSKKNKLLRFSSILNIELE